VSQMTPQSIIAHNRIVSKLGEGEGGMGEVWRATDTKLGLDVAIKILPEAFAADVDRMARFAREAHIFRRFQITMHPALFMRRFQRQQSDGQWPATLPASNAPLVRFEHSSRYGAIADYASREPPELGSKSRPANGGSAVPTSCEKHRG